MSSKKEIALNFRNYRKTLSPNESTLTDRFAFTQRLHSGLPSSHLTLLTLHPRQPVRLRVYLVFLVDPAWEPCALIPGVDAADRSGEMSGVLIAVCIVERGSRERCR